MLFGLERYSLHRSRPSLDKKIYTAIFQIIFLMLFATLDKDDLEGHFTSFLHNPIKYTIAMILLAAVSAAFYPTKNLFRVLIE
jgi:fumarate reductase subunit C